VAALTYSWLWLKTHSAAPVFRPPLPDKIHK